MEIHKEIKYINYILGALIEVGQNPPERGIGLCTNVKFVLRELCTSADFNEIRDYWVKNREIYWKDWPFYSGSDIYPVPDTDLPGLESDDRIQRASKAYDYDSDMYDPSTRYGRLRLDLLDYLYARFNQRQVELSSSLDKTDNNLPPLALRIKKRANLYYTNDSLLHSEIYSFIRSNDSSNREITDSFIETVIRIVRAVDACDDESGPKEVVNLKNIVSNIATEAAKYAEQPDFTIDGPDSPPLVPPNASDDTESHPTLINPPPMKLWEIKEWRGEIDISDSVLYGWWKRGEGPRYVWEGRRKYIVESPDDFFCRMPHVAKRLNKWRSHVRTHPKKLVGGETL